MPLRSSKNGANQARSRLLASERKSYQLTFHRDKLLTKGFFCITETKIATGLQKIFPSKWQVFNSDRIPLHRVQQPAFSIFRGRSSSSTTSRREKCAKVEKLRFAPRVDQRFYIKNSESVQQLVKLSWDGSGLEADQYGSPSSFDLVDITTPETACEHIGNFIGAVQNDSSIEKIVPMLQEDIDRTREDASLSEDWLAELYRSVKERVGQSSPPPLSNLTQIHKLLSIYKHSETAINSARALKQWSRFEVTIESVLNLQPEISIDGKPRHSSNEPLVGEMYYSSDRMDSRMLGKLPPAHMASIVDYSANSEKDRSSSKRYCLNHNFGLADERPELTLHLRQGKHFLGKLVVPCSIFRYFSTQPNKTFTVERQLNLSPEAGLEQGAKVRFSIRKVPLKPGFLDDKRNGVATKVNQLVGWIQKFNKVNLSSTQSALLSAHICAQDNVSLLHAAIYAQDVRLVKILMKMGANPHLHSGVGSAMTLALNQSESDKQRFEIMIELMQGNYSSYHSDNSSQGSRSSGDERENDSTSQGSRSAVDEKENCRRTSSSSNCSKDQPKQHRKQHRSSSSRRKKNGGLRNGNTNARYH